MNKKMSLLIALCLYTFLFSACRKCINCVAKQTVNNLSVETPYDTFCGNSEDIAAFEKGLKSQVSDNITISCEIQ